MKAINIQWDVDDEKDLEFLPTEIEIPDDINVEDDDEISDYLSDVTGFCHKGFILVITKNFRKQKENFTYAESL